MTSSPSETPYLPLTTPPLVAGDFGPSDAQPMGLEDAAYGMKGPSILQTFKHTYCFTPGRRIFGFMLCFAFTMTILMLIIVKISHKNDFEILLLVNSSNLLLAASGESFAFTITASGGRLPYSYSSSSLPPFLELKSNGSMHGSVSCTEGKLEEHAFTVTVMDKRHETALQQHLLICLGKGVGTIIQLTDIHYTDAYASGASPQYYCKAQGAVLTNQAYKYGQFGCDAPATLVKSVAQTLLTTYATTPASILDAVLVTGDLAAHRSKDAAEAASLVMGVKKIIDSYLPTGTKILPSLGNNDFYPNYQSPVDNSQGQMPMLSAIFQSAPSWLSETQASSFAAGGYFAVTLNNKTKHKILILNTVYYSVHCSTAFGLADPGGQFSWLTTELQEAKTRGYKVYLMAHIPPGQTSSQGDALWFSNYTSTFLTLLSPYRDVVVACFMGHEHTDEFRLFNSQTLLVLQNAAVSPVYDDNPTFRIFAYDQSNLKIINWYNMYTDLSKQTQSEHGLVWRFEYSPVSVYQLDTLDSRGFAQLQVQIAEGPSNIFYNLYANAYGSALHLGRPTPDPAYVVCTIEFASKNDFDACVKNLQIGRRRMANR
eukprot:gb/GEZN01003792.1/.p1 GENE.gb/GEZN01003792.1/~~gb/GEZN01003792.1/.p1  ORF type:complete len:598 (-),score=63.91 gb/GEZN01003792.1/:237-2030(-)